MGNVYNNFFDKEIWKEVNNENKELLKDFILELKQNKKSSGTIYQYEKDIMGLYIYIYRCLTNRSILDLTKKDFRGYSLYLTGECGVSNARHNRLLSSMRSLLTFAENEDDYEYDNNVSKKVKGLEKEPVREIFFLTDDQVMKLKAELIRRELYQYATLLMLAYDSAGRKAELAGVKKQSFYDENKSNTNKVTGKRRKVFSLVYFSGTKECAKLWLDQRGEDNLDAMWIIGKGDHKREADKENIYDWFMNIRDILTEIEGKEIEFNVHSMRHSCLQNLSDGSHYICRELGMGTGFPIEKLKLIANHSDISTTSHYLKDNSVDELAEMFNIKIV
jgi:integrase